MELYRAVAIASLNGEAPYSVAIGAEDREVYKYPPWTIPIFWPLAWLPLKAAKVFWALVSLLGLAATVIWTAKRSRLWIAFFAAALWQNVWIANGRWGQINLPLIALLLWTWREGELSWIRSQLILFGASFKVFFAPIVLARIDAFKRPAVIFGAPLFLGILALPVWIASWDRGPLEIWRELAAASSSGDAMYSKAVIREWPNQGLPALVLRLFDVEASSIAADLVAFVVIAAIAIPLWMIASKRLAPAEQWVGWLGLLTAIHPLAWSYNFAFAYPLLVVALDRAWSFDRRVALPLAIAGGLAIAPPLGPIFSRVPLLALASPRGLAVLLLLFALLRALRTGEEHNRMPP